jgi:hypothetical protein
MGRPNDPSPNIFFEELFKVQGGEQWRNSLRLGDGSIALNYTQLITLSHFGF